MTNPVTAISKMLKILIFIGLESKLGFTIYPPAPSVRGYR
jgi:hypothetical protein